MKKAIITFYRTEVGIGCCWGSNDVRRQWKELHLFTGNPNSDEYRLLDFLLTNNGKILDDYIKGEMSDKITRDDTLDNRMTKPPFNINKSFKDFLFGSKDHLQSTFIELHGPIEKFKLIRKGHNIDGDLNNYYFFTLPFNLKEQKLDLESEYRNIQVNLIQN